MPDNLTPELLDSLLASAQADYEVAKSDFTKAQQLVKRAEAAEDAAERKSVSLQALIMALTTLKELLG